MKLVHKQILKEHVSLFLLSLGCLLGLIILGRLLQLREILLAQDLGPLELFRLVVYLVPFFMLLITPISSMLSVFLTFLRMSTDNELTALRAGGVSLYQLMPAPVIFSVGCTVLCLVISFWGLAWGIDNFKSTLLDFARTRTRMAMQAGVFNQEFPGLTFYSHRVNLDDDEMRFVFVQDTTHEGSVITIVAPTGYVQNDPGDGEVEIVFRNGRIYRRESENLDVIQFGTYAVRLPFANLIARRMLETQRPSEMSWAQLSELSQSDETLAEKGEGFVHNLKVEMVKRMTLPFGALVLGLFAVPVACLFRGLRQQFGLVLAMGCFLIYYSLFSLAVSFGESRFLDARIGLWLPNVLFLLMALLGVFLVNSERSLPLVLWWRQLRRARGAAQ